MGSADQYGTAAELQKPFTPQTVGHAAEKHKASWGGVRAPHSALKTGRQWGHFPFPHKSHAPVQEVHVPSGAGLEGGWTSLHASGLRNAAETPPFSCKHGREESNKPPRPCYRLTGLRRAVGRLQCFLTFLWGSLISLGIWFALFGISYKTAKHLSSNTAVSSKWSETVLSLNQNQQSQQVLVGR